MPLGRFSEEMDDIKEQKERYTSSKMKFRNKWLVEHIVRDFDGNIVLSTLHLLRDEILLL